MPASTMWRRAVSHAENLFWLPPRPERNGSRHRPAPRHFFKIAVNVCRKLRIKLFQPFFQENENAASGPLFHQAGQSIISGRKAPWVKPVL